MSKSMTKSPTIISADEASRGTAALHRLCRLAEKYASPSAEATAQALLDKEKTGV
jgi:hypothetical protein